VDLARIRPGEHRCHTRDLSALVDIAGRDDEEVGIPVNERVQVGHHIVLPDEATGPADGVEGASHHLAPVVDAALKDDVETLMNTLAEGLAKGNNRSIAEMYEERDKVRRSGRFAAMVARHSELHPDPVPEHDEIFRSAFHDSKDDEETAIKLAGLYGYMFTNQPMEPKLIPIARKGLWQRFFHQ
jgi:hypothetical protein